MGSLYDRRSMQFYYPNFQNDMRRILGLIFYHDTTFFIAPNGTSFDETKAKAFCEEKGICLPLLVLIPNHYPKKLTSTNKCFIP
jgi:G:T/U-mismatch repair DNA glycosylase